MSLKKIWALVKETFSEWSDDKASRLAAALAYYTIFSLPPLLILVIAIAGSVLGEEAARGEIVSQLHGLIGTEGAKFVEGIIASASKPGAATITASITSGIVLLFGATAVVIQLQDALNTIWEVTPKPGTMIKTFVFHRLLSFGMVMGVAFLLLVSLIASAMLAILSDYLGSLFPWMESVWPLVDFAASVALVTLLFALMFKYLPDAKINWSDVFVGAFLTALLFTLGKFLIGFYLGKSAVGSTYGAAGSLVGLLFWIYYSAQILFLGAEFTQVYTRRYGSRIQPVAYAERVNDEMRAQQGIPKSKST